MSGPKKQKKPRMDSDDGGPSQRGIPFLDRPANPAIHVVLPMTHTAEGIMSLVQNDKEAVAFVRSGVGNGKTSVANFIATKPGYHLVDVPRTSDVKARTRVVEATIIALVKACCHVDAKTLRQALKELGTKGHTLIFDEAHLVFATDLCGDLFKDPPCNILLFSAASQATDGAIESVTPAAITGRYIWTPSVPTDDEIDGIIQQLNAIDVMNVDKVIFDVIYMLSSGNRSVFVHILWWIRENTFANVNACLAGIRDSLQSDWDEPGSLREAMAGSRAVRANGPFTDPSFLPQEFVHIVAGGPMRIGRAGVRRALTVGGLLVPQPDVTNPPHELFRYSWDNPETKYAVSSSLRSSYYRSILSRDRSLRVKCDAPAFQTDSHCAELCARAFPMMSFDTVVAFPIPDPDGNLSLRSAISSTTNLAPEDAYNAAFQAALKAQDFEIRDFNSDADGGKVDHFCKPDMSIEVAHFHNTRKKHAERFKDPEKWTYRMCTHRAFMVLCKSKHQVETFLSDKQPDGVDFIAVLVSTSHEAYTMTVKPAGAARWPPLVLRCDHVAKKIVRQPDGSLILESAQKLASITGMKYLEEEAVAPMEMAGPAAVSDTVVISVQLGAAGAAVKVKFSRSAVSADIKEAIRDRLRLRLGTRFELVDTDGVGVTIDGNLEPSNYIVEVIE